MNKKIVYNDNSERSVNMPDPKQVANDKIRLDAIKQNREKLKVHSDSGTKMPEVKKERSRALKLLDSTKKVPSNMLKKKSSRAGTSGGEPPPPPRVIKNKRVNKPFLKMLSTTHKSMIDEPAETNKSIKTSPVPQFDKNLPKIFTPKFRILTNFIEKYVTYRNSLPKDIGKDKEKEKEAEKSESGNCTSKEDEELEVNDDTETPTTPEIPVTFFLNKDRVFKSQLSNRRVPRHLIPMEFYAKKMNHLWDETVSYDLVKQSLIKQQTSLSKVQTSPTKTITKEESFKVQDNDYSSGIATGMSKTLKNISNLPRKLLNNTTLDNRDIFPYHYFDDALTIDAFLRYVDPLMDDDDGDDGAS